jgi:hypothetical protein
MPLHADGPHSQGSATAAGNSLGEHRGYELLVSGRRCSSISWTACQAFSGAPAAHASDLEFASRYELVTICEALHDMNHSVQALRGTRILLSTAQRRDRRRARGRALHRPRRRDRTPRLRAQRARLPVDVLDEHSAPNRTVIGPDTVRAYATESASAASSVGDRGRPRALLPAPAPRRFRSTAPHGVRHLAPGP